MEKTESVERRKQAIRRFLSVGFKIDVMIAALIPEQVGDSSMLFVQNRSSLFVGILTAYE